MTISTNTINSSPAPATGAYSAQEVEAKWTSIWFEHKLFDLKIKEGKPFYSGALPPPNITGNLHMGHALNGTLQDVLFRYKRMQGFNVLWQPGTDHAGISTQMVVERKLKKEGLSRHDLGREAFLKQVWEWRDQYGSNILNQYKRLGVTFAWNRIAFTMDDYYVRAINKVFVQLFKEGLIYRGNRVVNWCPRCLTSLSDLEVQHAEQSGHLYIITYPLVDGSGSLNIATTRPETIFADVAVAVNPEDARYSKYVGQKVKLPLTNRQIPVIADSYVEKEFGTGVLKITPAHDANDFEVGQRHNLEKPVVIDEAGKLLHDPLVPAAYQGMERFAARKKVAEDLAEQGFLVESKKYDNAVGLCDRCSTVIEPRLSDQWYMSMKELVKPAIQVVENHQIEFVPERYSATYLDWMKNIRDWCISRQLWWGQRIPIWTCTSCGAQDAYEEAPVKCHKCGKGTLEQDPDVLDTWFSSGLFPFATLGWPEQTPEMENFYPTNVLVTAREIINLWVSRMVFFSLKITGKIPFKDVLIHPVIQTADGKRMSKSKGNAVDPLDMIEKYGADANRFWFTSIGLKGDQDVRFREDKLEEYKRFVNKLWNAGKFVISRIGQKRDFKIDPTNLSLADRWILSRYNQLLDKLEAAYDNYDYQIIAGELYEFTWDYFCDWYLEISKIDQDKGETEKVLYTIFEGLLRALHPVMPFITEELWHQITQTTENKSAESVLLVDYPEANKDFYDEQAELEMEHIIRLVRSIRNLRQTYNVPHSSQIQVILEHANNQVKANHAYIEKLTTTKLLFDADTQNMDRCATDTVGNTIITVPLANVIDVEKTKDKLILRIQAIEKELQKTRQVFNSDSFKTKAPADKVELVKNQLESAEQQLHQLEAQLKVLN